MNPPRVKVAVITEGRDIKLRCTTPINLKSTDDRNVTFAAGEVTISTNEPLNSQKKSWLWCGSYFNREEAQRVKDTVSKQGFQARLWSVGLTPETPDWQPRQFRLLVESSSQKRDYSETIHLIRKALPEVIPVEIEMPSGSSPATLHIEDSNNKRRDFLQTIQLDSEEPFELFNAPIGRGFHWEHSENLILPSPVWISVDTTRNLCAGVEVTIEEYLLSVNSSEMPAESPIEFLKAQVVAARSWLLANWGSHHPEQPYIVCAGDHCQCYYGLSRVQESSKLAVESTTGQVLMYDGRICDARYAKSCGGVSESGSNTWPFMNEPYLGHVRDLPSTSVIDLSAEKDYREFQLRSASADACCAPGYAPLRGKLEELTQLYRWTVETSAAELEEIIRYKTGHVLGRISDIITIKRGPSGRLIKVEVVGRQDRCIFTPELEIRRCLRRTHLPSSAFWIERPDEEKFIFHGSGWGHGAGLCQVGAAALAQQGFDYKFILNHYYPTTSIKKIY